MTADRPLVGIVLMLAFCIVIPLSDGLAKLATDSLPVLQIVAMRFVLGSILILPVIWATGRSLRLPTGTLWPAVARTGCHVMAFVSLLAALVHLPLAETMAIAFVQPFLMLALAWALMGETVGPRRLAACVGGFAGTLMVIQPSFAQAGWVVVLPLVAAVGFTGFMLFTRRIAKSCDALSLQAFSGLLALPMLLPFLALGPLLGLPALAPVWPDAQGWGLVWGIAGLATVAHLLMTVALRLAPASTLAPIQYMELPVTVVVGWMMFRDFPDGMALSGIAVICAAGLYMVHRERQISRRPTAPAQPMPHRAQTPAIAQASVTPRTTDAPPGH
ncbi:MAG: DMT family transporter [Alkalilacustris sp.]